MQFMSHFTHYAYVKPARFFGAQVLRAESGQFFVKSGRTTQAFWDQRSRQNPKNLVYFVKFSTKNFWEPKKDDQPGVSKLGKKCMVFAKISRKIGRKSGQIREKVAKSRHPGWLALSLGNLAGLAYVHFQTMDSIDFIFWF